MVKARVGRSAYLNVNRALRIAGIAACSLSLLVMSGGHLFALQSFAWLRMAVEFSKSDSVQVAVAKALGGQHPCSLCLKVQKSWQEKQKQEKELPSLASDNLPEAVCDFRQTTLPRPTTELAFDGICPTPFFYNLSESPPKPPPRG